MTARAERDRRRLEATAYHEAGHAVVAVRLGVKVRSVHIIPDGDTAGACLGRPFPEWFSPDIELNAKGQDLLDREVMVLLAGAKAAKRFTGRYNHGGAASDYRAAAKLALYRCSSERTATKYLDWLGSAVDDMLGFAFNWRAVELVAAALLDRRSLSGRALPRIIAGGAEDLARQRTAGGLP